ncbi:hypothetical protein BJV82DRAFT_56982 [Fennellomyces sp. T-0311]|nr:hypothetical protein BJV82DRAFT_56982 [Fennellomyces sp. T-0311]
MHVLLTFVLLLKIVLVLGVIRLNVDEATIEPGSLINIYIEDIDGSLSFGELNKFTIIGETKSAKRLVWAVPSDLPYNRGHFFVTQNGIIIGKSESYKVAKRNPRKRWHPELHQFHAMQYHRKLFDSSQQLFVVNENAKSKRIGIIGAGASGLFSAYLLEQAGFTNYEILEGSDRMGGRIQTVFFDDTSYQELGAMRIPYSFNYQGKVFPLRDQAVVFQLAEELNGINEDQERVEFIPWIQSTDNNLMYYNGVRLPNGRVPTKGDMKNHSIAPPGDPLELATEVTKATHQLLTDELMESMAADLHKAYTKVMEEGYGDWSEWGWLHNKMGVSLNATEYYLGSSGLHDVWTNMYDVFFHERTSKWYTVQGGASRLVHAFKPAVGDKITYNTKISKIKFDKDKRISVQWKEDLFDEEYQSKSFDNVIVSAPFIIVRTWHLPQELPYTLKRAIQNLEHGDSCKVVLEFQTRFWEYYDKPIHGGCDSTDLPIGLVCYPPTANNGGRGLMIASYADDKRMRFSAMSEREHVARVLEYVEELHGSVVREQYTGRYARKCWNLDPFTGAAWADPGAGQRKMFMRSYFEHAGGLVFVGEHTDIKQSWISSALHSALRGVAMVLVEHGYISEARSMARHWKATWLNI